MHLRPLTIVFLMSAATAGFTQTYKWVDQNGVVSYSQTPPPSTQAETVDITPTPVVGNSDNSDELQRLRQRLEDSSEAAEIKRQNCSTARSNLENLLNSGNRMMKTTDGDYLRLSESERQTRIQAAREQIEANCKN